MGKSKSPKSERAKLAKQYRDKLKSFNKTIENIVKKLGKTPGTSAVEDAIKKGKLIKSTRKKTISQLKKMMRELDYLKNLKTTNFKGADEFKKTFRDVEKKLEQQNKIDKFYKLYHHMVEEFGYDRERHYIYVDIIENVLLDNEDADDDELQKRVDDLYNGVNEYEEGVEFNNIYTFK